MFYNNDTPKSKNNKQVGEIRFELKQVLTTYVQDSMKKYKIKAALQCFQILGSLILNMQPNPVIPVKKDGVEYEAQFIGCNVNKFAIIAV
jgi:hypothetical protein